MSHEVITTLDWFNRAIPTPTDDNRRVQRGCHFEEIAEELENLTITSGFIHQETLLEATRLVRELSELLKKGELDVEPVSRKLDLDAAFDQYVTNIGKMYVMGYDVIPAINHGNGSNRSKFDEDGNPVFQENGKIGKNPSTYYEPDFGQFV